MWAVVALFVLLLACYLWVNRPRRPPNFPPGPPTFLIFGNLFDLLKTTSKDFLKQLGRLRTEYHSDVIGLVDPFGQKLVHVYGGRLIKQVGGMSELAGRPEFFTVQYFSEMKRAGIFFNEGPRWQEQRRFTLKHLRDLGLGKSMLNTMIADEFTLFSEYIKKRLGEEIKINKLFNGIVLNIIWKMVADHRFDYDDPDIKRLEHLITKFTQVTGPQNILTLFPSARFIAPEASGFNTLKFYHSEASAFFTPILDEHEATLTPNHPRDFIDAYLIESKLPGASERGFDKLNLLTTVMDLFVAGSETTSTSLTWAILLLVLHPDVEAKMQEELDRVLGRDRLPSYEDRPRLPYTEAVMTEVWRYSSFVPLAVPHKAREPVKVDGYTIPQGAIVMMHLHSAHHDREHWGDPETFRPERFLGDDGRFKKDDFFVQFSLGKRACIGESMARTEFFTFMACLFHQFRLKLPKGAKKPAMKVQQFAIFLQPEDFNVIMEERA